MIPTLEPNPKLYKAAQLLEEAIEVVITLKVSERTGPLKRVVLEKLQKDLQGIHSLLRELQMQLVKNPGDNRQGWRLINKVFHRLTEHLFKLLTLLFCKLFSLRRVSRYIHAYR